MYVNGKKMDYKESMTLVSLLEDLSINPDLVVIEIDGEIVPKENYSLQLKEKNKIEIVSFVGGG